VRDLAPAFFPADESAVGCHRIKLRREKAATSRRAPKSEPVITFHKTFDSIRRPPLHRHQSNFPIFRGLILCFPTGPRYFTSVLARWPHELVYHGYMSCQEKREATPWGLKPSVMVFPAGTKIILARVPHCPKPFPPVFTALRAKHGQPINPLIFLNIPISTHQE
jgi:hypothetical protein